jgi:hypothetical protein
VIDGNVVNNSGEVHPGNSPGILTIHGDYTQGAAGVLDIELDRFGAAAGVGGSMLDIDGNLILPANLATIDFDFTDFDFSTFRTGNGLDFLAADNLTPTLLGDLDFTVSGAPVSSQDFRVLIDPNNGQLEIQATTNVPEPGPWLLLGSGLFSLLALRRRKSRQAA